MREAAPPRRYRRLCADGNKGEITLARCYFISSLHVIQLKDGIHSGIVGQFIFVCFAPLTPFFYIDE